MMVDFKNYDDVFNRDNYPFFDKKNYMPMEECSCVCLSGRLYEECCKEDLIIAMNLRGNNPEKALNELGELYKKKTKKLLSSNIENKSLKKKNVSYCSACRVYTGCDTNNLNIRSHTMAKGSILKKLSNGDGLISFNDHEISSIEKVQNEIEKFYVEVSENDASTTVSFCKKHDDQLFQDIEKEDYTDYKMTDKQNLEYALKAITFDIYYKIINIRYLSELIKRSKFITKNPDGSDSDFFKNYFYGVKSLFELHPLMIRILEQLKNEKEDPNFVTVVFELPNNRVNYSMSEIMVLKETVCYINVINCQKPFLIVSYYKNKGRITCLDDLKERYNESLLFSRGVVSNELIEITKLLIINAQNIYFNKSAIESLPNELKKYLYVIHREGTKDIPKQTQVNYDKLLLKVLYDI